MKHYLSRPGLLEKVAYKVGRFARDRRRMGQLVGTSASTLQVGLLSTLELCQLILPDDVTSIWDVGANRGTWTRLGVALFPKTPIFAFEPLPELAQSLAESQLPNVRCIPLALGARNGERQLHVTSNLDSSSILNPTKALEDAFGVTEVSQIPVKVISAQSFLDAE